MQKVIHDNLCLIRNFYELQMSDVSSNANSAQNNAFLDFLTVIGNEIPKEALAKLKVLLRGYVDKEILDYSVENGTQLLLILHKRGLVTNKRLSFLRKFLKEAKCSTSLSYLDSYVLKNKTWPGKYIRRDIIWDSMFDTYITHSIVTMVSQLLK